MVEGSALPVVMIDTKANSNAYNGTNANTIIMIHVIIFIGIISHHRHPDHCATSTISMADGNRPLRQRHQMITAMITGNKNGSKHDNGNDRINNKRASNYLDGTHTPRLQQTTSLASLSTFPSISFIVIVHRYRYHHCHILVIIISLHTNKDDNNNSHHQLSSPPPQVSTINNIYNK